MWTRRGLHRFSGNQAIVFAFLASIFRWYISRNVRKTFFFISHLSSPTLCMEPIHMNHIYALEISMEQMFSSLFRQKSSSSTQPLSASISYRLASYTHDIFFSSASLMCTGYYFRKSLFYSSHYFFLCNCFPNEKREIIPTMLKPLQPKAYYKIIQQKQKTTPQMRQCFILHNQ